MKHGSIKTTCAFPLIVSLGLFVLPQPPRTQHLISTSRLLSPSAPPLSPKTPASQREQNRNRSSETGKVLETQNIFG